jgi:hypothetical protein
MRSATETIGIEQDAARVFDFVSRPENLPQWAVGFCKDIRWNGNRWIVDTGNGDVGLKVVADEKRGVVDFHMSPAPGVEAVAYSRVIPRGRGAEYVFTFFQEPHLDDAAFEAGVRTLGDELRLLRTRLEPCPTSSGQGDRA